MRGSTLPNENYSPWHVLTLGKFSKKDHKGNLHNAEIATFCMFLVIAGNRSSIQPTDNENNDKNLGNSSGIDPNIWFVTTSDRYIIYVSLFYRYDIVIKVIVLHFVYPFMGV